MMSKGGLRRTGLTPNNRHLKAEEVGPAAVEQQPGQSNQPCHLLLLFKNSNTGC